MVLRAYAGTQTWWNGLRERAHDERGATAVEYALMVALIAAVIIAAVQLLGTNASSKFDSVGNAISTAGS